MTSAPPLNVGFQSKTCMSKTVNDIDTKECVHVRYIIAVQQRYKSVTPEQR